MAIISVDFDGTCVSHEYPNVGHDIGAVPVLKELVRQGHNLILFTMRSGTYLDDAIRWAVQNKIEFWGFNENPDQKSWTTSPKPYAHLYIDDAAACVPLVMPAENDFGDQLGRPYVDWEKMTTWLVDQGYIITGYQEPSE